MEFQWDSGNMKHVLSDHPERDNTVEEVESVFRDPYFKAVPDRVDSGEQQYSGVGIGNEGVAKHVVFVIRNGQIRPVTCRPASRKQRSKYEELRNQTQNEHG